MPKDSQNDFFSVGAPKPKARVLDPDEETKDWKDIKPRQQYDALNKQVFRKRKREEFEAAQAKRAQERTLPFNTFKNQKRFKKNET